MGAGEGSEEWGGERNREGRGGGGRARGGRRRVGMRKGGGGWEGVVHSHSSFLGQIRSVFRQMKEAMQVGTKAHSTADNFVI